MVDVPDNPEFNYQEPETQEDLHRPVGVPRPREIKSQKAQLTSEHQQGTEKNRKMNMTKKIGLESKEK